MKRLVLRGVVAGLAVGLGLAFFSSPMSVHASPFGWGVFGANVPFGSSTSLSISLGGNVAITMAPNGANFSGTGAHTVTVTSTDVVGYQLYVHTTGSTNMTSSSASIPASSNSSAAALALNSWGYNTTGSTTNFLGMPATSTLIKNASGPFTSGDQTTVTYGAYVDPAQPADTYSTAVTYTAVAKNQ
jgi:hypothetical protein